jgi:hypothetical protein
MSEMTYLPGSPKQPTDEEFRRAACDAMRRPRQTRYVTCCRHGQRALIANVYAMNNWEMDDDGSDLGCDPGHPYCFAWCDRNGPVDPRATRSPERKGEG